jgi:hypothetical protein
MSDDDPDLPKANHALLIIRQARLLRNQSAAVMIANLIYETPNTAQRSPEIDEAQQAAWLAISELARALKHEPLKKNSSRLPRFGRLHSERPRAGVNC